MQGEMGERDDTAGGVVVSSLTYRFWRNTGPCQESLSHDTSQEISAHRY